MLVPCRTCKGALSLLILVVRVPSGARQGYVPPSALPAGFSPNLALAPVDASDDDTPVPTSQVHWHPHTVASLAFASDGSMLVSGGEEGVLVLWQVRRVC